MKYNATLSAAVAAILAQASMLAYGATPDGAADGQTTPAPAAQTAQATPEAEAIQQVTVTAQRRTESAQNVPITIQALTGDTLKELNLATADETFRYLPNVTVGDNGPGQSNIFMRGLALGTPGTQSSGTIGQFPNVAVYLDEQSAQLPSHNLDIYAADIERIEILEGPQGTLFGGGAEAGVVRYITNKPKLNKFEGDADASYGITAGGDPNTSVTAVINLPIWQDKMAFRAVFYNDQRGGYIDNVYSTFTRRNTDVGIYYANYAIGCSVGTPTNGMCPTGSKASAFGVPPGSPVINNAANVQNNFNPVRYQGIRASLLTQITDDWSLLITQMYQTLHSDGVFYELPKSSEGVPLADYQTTTFTPNYNNDYFENTAWVVNGKLWELNLVYAGAYLNRRIDTQNDYTNYARGVYADYYQCYGAGTGIPTAQCYSPQSFWREHQKNTHQTQELRLSTPDAWRVRGIVGGYWEQYLLSDQTDWFYKTMPACTTALDVGCLTDVAPVPGVLVTNPGIRPDNDAFNEDVHRGYTQTAVFGSIDWDIIPKVLTISAGTRHYHYALNMYGSVQSSFGCYEAGPPPCYGAPIIDPYIPGSTGLSSSYSGFKSRGNITWHILPDVMAYATWSQGYRPGGFNRNTAGELPSTTQTYVNSKGATKNVPQYVKPLYYAPDNLTNYEGGVKTEFLDHHILLNASYYYEKWENTQIQLFNPAEFGNLTFTTNGPDYRVRGLELQLTAVPFTGLTLTGSGSWNQSSQTNSPLLTDNNCGQLAGVPASTGCGQPITTFVPPGGGSASALNPFGQEGGGTAFSPAAQWNFRARYDWVIKDYKPWVQLGVTHTDHYFNTVPTAPNGDLVSVITTTFLRYDIPSYSVWDGSLGVAKDNWTVQLYGQNLGDNNAPTFISSGQFIKAEFPLRPRVLGLRATMHF